MVLELREPRDTCLAQECSGSGQYWPEGVATVISHEGSEHLRDMTGFGDRETSSNPGLTTGRLWPIVLHTRTHMCTLTHTCTRGVPNISPVSTDSFSWVGGLAPPRTDLGNQSLNLSALPVS